jgi:DNA-binding NarL/FixJ family response regulator
VFVSGLDDARDDAFEAGATDVLAKSADPDRLLLALRNVAAPVTG